MPYQLTELADDDLAEIIENRASLSVPSAVRLHREFKRVFDLIGRNPGIGKEDERLPPGTRLKLVEDRWAVLYPDVPKGEMVTISRIAHVTAELRALFAD